MTCGCTSDPFHQGDWILKNFHEPCLVTTKMEAECSSETLQKLYITQWIQPEYHNLYKACSWVLRTYIGSCKLCCLEIVNILQVKTCNDKWDILLLDSNTQICTALCYHSAERWADNCSFRSCCARKNRQYCTVQWWHLVLTFMSLICCRKWRTWRCSSSVSL